MANLPTITQPIDQFSKEFSMEIITGSSTKAQFLTPSSNQIEAIFKIFFSKTSLIAIHAIFNPENGVLETLLFGKKGSVLILFNIDSHFFHFLSQFFKPDFVFVSDQPKNKFEQLINAGVNIQNFRDILSDYFLPLKLTIPDFLQNYNVVLKGSFPFIPEGTLVNFFNLSNELIYNLVGIPVIVAQIYTNLIKEGNFRQFDFQFFPNENIHVTLISMNHVKCKEIVKEFMEGVQIVSIGFKRNPECNDINIDIIQLGKIGSVLLIQTLSQPIKNLDFIFKSKSFVSRVNSVFQTKLQNFYHSQFKYFDVNKIFKTFTGKSFQLNSVSSILAENPIQDFLNLPDITLKWGKSFLNGNMIQLASYEILLIQKCFQTISERNNISIFLETFSPIKESPKLLTKPFIPFTSENFSFDTSLFQFQLQLFKGERDLITFCDTSNSQFTEIINDICQNIPVSIYVSNIVAISSPKGTLVVTEFSNESIIQLSSIFQRVRPYCYLSLIASSSKPFWSQLGVQFVNFSSEQQFQHQISEMESSIYQPFLETNSESPILMNEIQIYDIFYSAFVAIGTRLLQTQSQQPSQQPPSIELIKQDGIFQFQFEFFPKEFTNVKIIPATHPNLSNCLTDLQQNTPYLFIELEWYCWVQEHRIDVMQVGKQGEIILITDLYHHYSKIPSQFLQSNLFIGKGMLSDLQNIKACFNTPFKFIDIEKSFLKRNNLSLNFNVMVEQFACNPTYPFKNKKNFNI